ncbi:GDSL-type esterase/lipase family protein [Microvirga lotononidis]|uniref:Lysophospholipase L1-like esterase n=2 Tax=Microvirga lotononidis TaxID=864069 RepID=I4Z182_9HYPH|nr:lysophospholipase L1-like esterase [Microvirga lotononidis]
MALHPSRSITLAWLLAALIGISPAAEHHQPIGILPIGDSITDGDGRHDSYRRHLWHLLRNAEYKVDFLGSRHLNGYYNEQPPNPDFDMDHEGHSGWTTRDVLSELSGSGEGRGQLGDWLSTHAPAFILLQIGTNDILKCEDTNGIVARIKQMVAIIHSITPSSTILISTVLPLGSAQSLGFDDAYCPGKRGLDTAVNALNQNLQGVLSEVARVDIVDLNRAIDPASDLYDGIHPNASGERRIAEAWFAAMTPATTR